MNGIDKGMRVEHITFPPIVGTVCVVQDMIGTNDKKIGVLNDVTNTIYYDLESTWVELLDDTIIDAEYREVDIT